MKIAVAGVGGLGGYIGGRLAQSGQAVTFLSLQICAGMGKFTFAYASMPLIQAGITPSSAQLVTQLASVGPAIRARLIALMSATPVNAAEVDE